MIRKEKSLIQRVLHVSNNTFPKCFPFLAKEYGLSQFSSLQANSFAARFRAASRTITSLESNRRALGEARACFGNLAMLGQLAHSLPWWDSPPIVDMVHQAAQGFGGQFGNLSAVVSEHARHHDDELSLGDKVEKNKSQLSVQAVLYAHILPMLYPDNLHSQIATRLRTWCFPVLGLMWPTHDLEEVIRNRMTLLVGQKKALVLSVYKTWCNGWPTNYRKHGTARSCIICGEQGFTDRLTHYIGCNVLWTAITQALALPRFSGPFDTLLLHEHNEASVLQAAFALLIALSLYQENQGKSSIHNLNRAIAEVIRRTRMYA